MKKLVHWFTGPIEGIVERYQALSIVIFLATLIVVSIVLWPISVKFESEFPYLFVITFCGALLILYKLTKSNLLVGNLTALLIYLAIVNLTFQSGGVYSLDLSGVILIPIIAINMAREIDGIPRANNEFSNGILFNLTRRLACSSNVPFIYLHTSKCHLG